MSTAAARARARREAARQRVLSRVTEGMTATQHAFDPLARDAAIDPWGLAALALLGALAVHGSIYGIGKAIDAFGDGDGPRERPTRIVVRERPPEPPDPPKPPPPPEPVAVTVPDPVSVTPEPPPPEPKIKPKAKPPEPAPEPTSSPEPKAKPPPRVTGIDFEATSAGGTGGSFGVGNTNAGKTDDRAADPKKVVRGGKGDGKDEPTRPPPKADPPPPNKTATKIPTAKAKVVMPRRKKPVTPGYPETLKSQGIEADVPVVVSIDEHGKVTDVKIAKKSGYDEFDSAATKAARAEVFEPATRDGVPVPYTISYTYRFRLEDK